MKIFDYLSLKITYTIRKTIFFYFIFLMVSTLGFSQQKRITPPYLKTGDTIAIVAPAGILKNRQATIDKAIALAESWGLKVVVGKNVHNQNNHFAGTDVERASDFQKALDNSNIKAIWCARGGYGSVRILDLLDFTKFKQHPKWIVGYSDITAFHNHIHNLDFETLHAMMSTSLEEKPEDLVETIATFKKALFGEPLNYDIKSSNYNRKGTAKGVLIGGNLSILTSMLGSQSQLNTDNKILFLEEIGEYKYSIDRMLQSLKRAGYFKNVKAVVLGNFSSVKVNSTRWGASIEELILDVIPKNIPILFDFPAGHEADNRALIFGREVEITVNNGSKQSQVKFKS